MDSNHLEQKHRFGSATVIQAAIIFSIVLTFAYIYIYQVYPFEGAWNDIILNSILSLSALFGAVVATAIYFHYQPGESPRVIWLNMALGCYLWFFAEATWSVLNYQIGEVPTPSYADIFWVLGFIFFTIAFYWQYLLIYPQQKGMILYTAMAAWLVSLLIPLVLLTTTNSLSISTYVDYFYPFADFSVGIAGLAVIFIFRGGMLTRSWVGLMVFGISDLLYAWAEQSGLYAWSADNNSILTLGIDTTYLTAYLILAVGFAGHWALLHYGIDFRRREPPHA